MALLGISLERYARDAPWTPAAEVLTPDALAVIAEVTEAEQLQPLRARAQPWGTLGCSRGVDLSRDDAGLRIVALVAGKQG